MASNPGSSEAEADTQSDTKPNEQNTNDMKNISPFMSKDLIAAAGFNVEAPIVEAIIGNLTGTLPTKRSETETIKCNICDCELSSNTALSIHTNGLRHKKRLKALEILAQLKDAKDSGVQFKRDCKNPNILRCEICSLNVNSAQQLEIHLSGAKHKRNVVKAGMLKELNLKNLEFNESTDSNPGPPAAKKKKDESKVISCNVCNIFVNSQTQYDEHMVSKKHTTRANKIAQKQVP